MKSKLFLMSFVLLLSLHGAVAQNFYAPDLVFEASQSVAGNSTNPGGLMFSPDGLRLYFSHVSGGPLHQYNLSTAWNISTATSRSSFAVSSQDTGPTSLWITPNGTKLYMTGNTNDRVYEYNLTTPWTLSSATFIQSLLVTARAGNPYGVYLVPNGTRALVLDRALDNLVEYSLSVAFNISTGTYLRNISVGGVENDPTGFTFGEAGMKLYVVGQTIDRTVQYNLTIPYDISTAVFGANGTDASISNPNGNYVDENGTRYYVIGSGSDAIAQYRFNETQYNLTITAVDFYNSTSLTVFNATVQWNGTTTSYTTTNGMIITNAVRVNASLPANITITATNYFLNSTVNHNLTSYQGVIIPYTAIRAISAVGAAVINNFTVEYTNNANSSDTGTYVTTNGVAYIPLFNAAYAVLIYNVFNASNTYTNGSASLTASPYLQGYNFSLYRVNTVNVSFYDLNTLARVNVVNLSMVGLTVTYNFVTTTGSIQQEVLNPDTYRMTATAANYSPSTVFLTLSGDNQTVNMYFDSSLTAITFSVQDTLGNIVKNASITITYNINGTYVTFAQAISDVFGAAVILLDQSSQYFISVTHPDYAVFSGVFTPSETTYLISLLPASSSTYTSLFQYASLQVEFDYDNSTSQLLITYDTVSGSGAIDYFGINASYNGVLYEQNVSGSAGGGTIVLNITPATASIQDLVNATYWLKVNGYDLYTAEKFFRLSQSSPGNTTLGGGLFEGPEQGLGWGGRAILGTIIVLIAVGIGMALGNGNITAGAIVGAAVAGGLTFGSFALFETTYGVLAVVLLIIIAIGDNI